MICNNCRRTFLARVRAAHGIPQIISLRSSLSIRQNSTNATAPPTPSGSISIPDSVSSTPLQSTHSQSGSTATLTSKIPTPKKLVSSIPGGTDLRGLGFLKAKPIILAKEDDQYPDWLWTLLNDSKSTKGDGVDLSAMTKKQRHKYDRKQERLQKNLAKPVPLHEQSINLTGPGDDVMVSLKRRNELTKSAREARRKEIREANFLRTM